VVDITKGCFVRGDIQLKFFHQASSRISFARILKSGYLKPVEVLSTALSKKYPYICLFRLSFHTSFVGRQLNEIIAKQQRESGGGAVTTESMGESYDGGNGTVSWTQGSPARPTPRCFQTTLRSSSSLATLTRQMIRPNPVRLPPPHHRRRHLHQRMLRRCVARVDLGRRPTCRRSRRSPLLTGPPQLWPPWPCRRAAPNSGRSWPSAARVTAAQTLGLPSIFLAAAASTRRPSTSHRPRGASAAPSPIPPSSGMPQDPFRFVGAPRHLLLVGLFMA
jgi:hypothetical protein